MFSQHLALDCFDLRKVGEVGNEENIDSDILQSIYMVVMVSLASFMRLMRWTIDVIDAQWGSTFINDRLRSNCRSLSVSIMKDTINALLFVGHRKSIAYIVI